MRTFHYKPSSVSVFGCRLPKGLGSWEIENGSPEMDFWFLGKGRWISGNGSGRLVSHFSGARLAECPGSLRAGSESPRSLRQLAECPWNLSRLSGTDRGNRSVLGVSGGSRVSQESLGLPECPWSIFCCPARCAAIGVSWESPAAPESPRSLRGSRSVPGDFLSCLAGARARKVSEKVSLESPGGPGVS